MNRRLLETIRCDGGVCHHLEYHQQRLDESLRILGITADYRLKELLSPPDQELYRCRVTYDAYTIEIEYLPYQRRSISTLQLIEADMLEYPLKYSDRKVFEVLSTLKGDADDLLIVKNGLIRDTTIANIAFFDGRRWFTPESPLLKGTTRARLLNDGLLSEREITAEAVDDYESFALMNAMIGFEIIKDGIILPLKRYTEGAMDVI